MQCNSTGQMWVFHVSTQKTLFHRACDGFDDGKIIVNALNTWRDFKLTRDRYLFLSLIFNEFGSACIKKRSRFSLARRSFSFVATRFVSTRADDESVWKLTVMSLLSRAKHRPSVGGRVARRLNIKSAGNKPRARINRIGWLVLFSCVCAHTRRAV